MSEMELRINVISALEELQSSLDKLHDAIKGDTSLIAWMQDNKTGAIYDNSIVARVKCFALLNQLEYVPEQAPREIIIGAGFIGAGSKTIELARQVNTAKDNFKHAVLTLKNAKISIKDETLINSVEDILNRRNIITKKTLHKIGLSRLHLKQCYRKIPILPVAPLKISWTWANTRSIKRISVNDAMAILKKKGKDEGIARQIAQLSMIPQYETLAIVQDLAPHLRANIVLPNGPNDIKRVMIKGPVPIFFPAEKSTRTPQFKAPKEKTAKNQDRLIRADVQLQKDPFIPAIRAHRYLKELKLTENMENIIHHEPEELIGA